MPLSFDDATTRLLRTLGTVGAVTSATVTLRVVDGPDAGLTLHVEDLAHRQLHVGKSSSCELRLTDPAVSRRHAVLELDERGVRVRDVGSSNGTFIDNVMVAEAILRGNETVRVGGSAFRVEVGLDANVVPASETAHYGSFVGSSPAVRRIYPHLERLAQIDVPVLFIGEPGTGKELLAEAVHDASARSAGPFLVFERIVGSAQTTDEALFGSGSKPGLFEQARGGTLFFDEIADLELPIQLKVLRALESKSIRRVSGTDAISVDVRCLAATRRDLDRDVQERRFREELLEFLSVHVDVPPLRRRRGDIALLTRFFWTQLGGNPAELPPALVERFEERSWAGNVRELSNAVAAYLAAGDMPPESREDEVSRQEDFLDALLKEGLALPRARERVTAEFERRYLKHMLEKHNGNVTRAAAASGISRRYFYRLRERE